MLTLINLLSAIIITVALVRDIKMVVAPYWHRMGLVLIAGGCLANAYCNWHIWYTGYCPPFIAFFERFVEYGVLILSLYYAYLFTKKTK